MTGFYVREVIKGGNAWRARAPVSASIRADSHLCLARGQLQVQPRSRERAAQDTDGATVFGVLASWCARTVRLREGYARRRRSLGRVREEPVGGCAAQRAARRRTDVLHEHGALQRA